jgi:hypothetical protein
MTHVEALEIPAGGTVSLERGGYHVMFMGLTGKLTEGEMHKATLIFEKAGRVEIEFQIDPPMGKGEMDHSTMDPRGHASQLSLQGRLRRSSMVQRQGPEARCMTEAANGKTVRPGEAR